MLAEEQAPAIDALDLENPKLVSSVQAEVHAHLARVYIALAGTTAMAGLGVAFYMVTHVHALLSFVVTLALLLYIHSQPESTASTFDAKAHALRLSALLGFGFFQGAGAGGLVAQVLKHDPSIVLTAFLGTVAIFASFSASALYARRRSYLYIGGMLFSCLSTLLLLGLANLFLGLEFLFLVSLYGGLALFCGYVLYDTQIILEKAHQGSRDYIRHALELFIDFVGIFIRLLIILSRRRD